MVVEGKFQQEAKVKHEGPRQEHKTEGQWRLWQRQEEKGDWKEIIQKDWEGPPEDDQIINGNKETFGGVRLDV